MVVQKKRWQDGAPPQLRTVHGQGGDDHHDLFTVAIRSLQGSYWGVVLLACLLHVSERSSFLENFLFVLVFVG